MKSLNFWAVYTVKSNCCWRGFTHFWRIVPSTVDVPVTCHHTNFTCPRFIIRDSWTCGICVATCHRHIYTEAILQFIRPDWRSDNARDSYSGGTQFKYRPGHWLCWLRFLVIFLSPFRQIQGQCNDRFLSKSSPIHYSPVVLPLDAI
jgi:hypothetical protein